MPKPGDGARLRHMCDAARDACGFVKDKSRADLDESRMLAFALVHATEIVGEAAARISSDTQAQHPDVPWSDIIGMRHRLAHGYYTIDLDRVWQTVLDDLPPLIAQLDRIIGDMT